MRMARLGVLLQSSAAERRWRYGVNVFECYMREMLDHAGIPYMMLQEAAEVGRAQPDILIVLLAEEDDATHDALLRYAEQGGVVISYAGLNRLAGTLGCVNRAPIGIGYAAVPDLDAERPLRFMEARPWTIKESAASGGKDMAEGRDSHKSEGPSMAAELLPGQSRSIPVRLSGQLFRNRPDGGEAGALLATIAYGEGAFIRWSVNVPAAVVALQQGTGPVVEDGVAAPDGSGDLDEGILKADDCCALDWEIDRDYTGTGMPYFAWPYADWWREAAIGQLVREAARLGLTLPFVGYWPDGVGRVALISHDSDHNIDASAEATLELLRQCGIRSTWCMIEPGYDPSLYGRIREEGHEIAFHYNALPQDGGHWGGEHFRRQLETMKRQTGGKAMTSNKNHYTRYEGWGELFVWCEAGGIEADQTRGPSKRGNVGFLFGTCHPYFPVAWCGDRNRRYDVLEIGFLTQDLNHPSLPDTSVIAPFLEQVERVKGVAHFLFHQVHLYERPQVAEALRTVVQEARARGFAFWTSEQINRWERSRRAMRITGVEGGRALVEQAAEGAVVWLPLADGLREGPAGDRAARTGDSLPLPSKPADAAMSMRAAAQASEGTVAIRYGIPCMRHIIGPSGHQLMNEEGILP